MESAAFQDSITCPRCLLTSYNPNDIEHKYCGNCHMFHKDLAPEDLPRCHCGKPIHYNDPGIRKWVEEQIRQHGEYMRVRNSEGRWFKVQRHYIALHGIKEWELHLLFEEIV